MKTYVDWIVGKGLPAWSMIGFDAEAGRFRERLDFAGKPLVVPHRAMVQSRQIYVFADAARRGWLPEGADLARRAMASLQRDFASTRDDMTSFAFSIDPHTRQIVSADRDAYTHAFVLFAIARLYALDEDPSLLALADRTIAFMERNLLDATNGGLHESFPRTLSHKRQNPQMHLLEAYLALERVAPGRQYIERATALVSLFREKLFHTNHGVLLEYFGESWTEHPDPAKSVLFEPGHHYEWIWLLNEHEQLAGEDLRVWRDRLNRPAEDHGHAASGLIYDELGPARQVVKNSHRLWPHTEAIKAATVRHAQGDRNALPFARKMADLLGEHFLDRAFEGGWIDHIDSNLEPLVNYVPASSLYHLYFAGIEADTGFASLQHDAALTA